MMLFQMSRKYALTLVAMIHIARQEEGRSIQAAELMAFMGSERRYLEPVLQSLTRGGVIKGLRGPMGGYQLARAANEISMLDVLECVNTTEVGPDRDLGLNADAAALLEPIFPQLVSHFQENLRRVTLADFLVSAEALRAA